MKSSDLLCPQFGQCRYEEETCSYRCEVELRNQTTHCFAIYLTSTFGKYLSETTGCQKIPPGQSKTLAFKLKATNTISNSKEKVFVIYYPQDSPLLISFPGSISKTIHLKFSQSFVQDQVIENIIRTDSQNLCTEGFALLAQGEPKKALQKFEEAFVKIFLFQHLCREVPSALFGISKCQAQMNSMQIAMQSIETALLLAAEPSFLLQKLKIGVKIYCKQPNDYYILSCCLRISKALKQQMLSNVKEQEEFESLNDLIANLLETSRAGRIRAARQRLLQLITDGFSQNAPLKKFYGDNANRISREAYMILRGDKAEPDSLPAPDFIIDPISYEIFVDPVLAPSGVTYERAKLLECIKARGPVDPMNRKELLPEWLVGNINLRRYIEKHPDLPKWQRSEAQLIKF